MLIKSSFFKHLLHSSNTLHILVFAAHSGFCFLYYPEHYLSLCIEAIFCYFSAYHVISKPVWERIGFISQDMTGLEITLLCNQIINFLNVFCTHSVHSAMYSYIHITYKILLQALDFFELCPWSSPATSFPSKKFQGK